MTSLCNHKKDFWSSSGSNGCRWSKAKPHLIEDYRLRPMLWAPSSLALEEGWVRDCQHASFITSSHIPRIWISWPDPCAFCCLLHCIENLSLLVRSVNGSLSLLSDGQLKLLTASSSFREVIRWSLRKHNHKLKLWVPPYPLQTVFELSLQIVGIIACATMLGWTFLKHLAFK